MKMFMDYARNRWNDIPEGNIPASWFAYHDLPIMVRCSCCEMSMVLPSAWVDDNGYTFCRDCADVSEN